MMSCKKCYAAEQRIYGPYEDRIKSEFITVGQGNDICLVKCIECDQLWCSSHYGPQGSYELLILWEHSIEDWKYIHGLDQGETLRNWHKQSIKQLWMTLPIEEQESINLHKHNPIEELQDSTPINLKELILRHQLKELFFESYLHEQNDLTVVQSFIFEHDELIAMLSFEDYEDLFRLKCDQRGSRYELGRILFNYFSRGEYEKRSLIHKLNLAKNDESQLPMIVGDTYGLYCSGYYFLEDLGLTWGLYFQDDDWMYQGDSQKEKWMAKHHSKILAGIEQVLTWLTTGQIVFLDEVNDFKYLKYIDKRNVNESESKYAREPLWARIKKLYRTIIKK